MTDRKHSEDLLRATEEVHQFQRQRHSTSLLAAHQRPGKLEGSFYMDSTYEFSYNQANNHSLTYWNFGGERIIRKSPDTSHVVECTTFRLQVVDAELLEHSNRKGRLRFVGRSWKEVGKNELIDFIGCSWAATKAEMRLVNSIYVSYYEGNR